VKYKILLLESELFETRREEEPKKAEIAERSKTILSRKKIMKK